MKQVAVIEEQTIYDIALQEYGDVRGVTFIQEDNTEILDSIDTELTPGMVLNIDETKKVTKDPVTKITPVIPTSFYEVVSEGQTLYDLAIQCYGGMEGVFSLIEDNPDLVQSLNDNIPVGSQIKVDESKVVNKDVLKYFKNGRRRVNSDDVPSSGVGYWRVYQDNVVS